jgi:hypothetical protein
MQHSVQLYVSVNVSKAAAAAAAAAAARSTVAIRQSKTTAV